MIRQIQHAFGGMNTDTSAQHYPPNNYVYAKNFTLLDTNEETKMGQLSSVDGNKLAIQLNTFKKTRPDFVNDNPGKYTLTYSVDSIEYTASLNRNDIFTDESTGSNLRIIHTKQILERIALFVKSENSDFILLYSPLKPASSQIEIVTGSQSDSLFVNEIVDSVVNLESENVIKIYWSDGETPLRSINLINKTGRAINLGLTEACPYVDGSPKINVDIVETSGRGLSNGRIQYAFNFIKKNGQQTKTLGITPMHDITTSDKMSVINEYSSKKAVIKITQNTASDSELFDVCRIYSIKYNTIDSDPIVSIVTDVSLSNEDITHEDDGSSSIAISLAEFVFLGGDPYVASSMESKDNRLFIAGISTGEFKVDFDARAWSSNKSGIYNVGNSSFNHSMFDTSAPIDNQLLDVFNRQPESNNFNTEKNTLGGYGRNLQYWFTAETQANYEEDRKFKSGETYRLAIQFYNKYRQKSEPHWIGDFRAPIDFNKYGVDNWSTYDLNVSINDSRKDSLSTQGVTGFSILVAIRRDSDRSVVSQGVIFPTSTRAIDLKNTQAKQITPIGYEMKLSEPSADYVSENIFPRKSFVVNRPPVTTTYEAKLEVVGDVCQMVFPESQFKPGILSKQVEIRTVSDYVQTSSSIETFRYNTDTKEIANTGIDTSPRAHPRIMTDKDNQSLLHNSIRVADAHNDSTNLIPTGEIVSSSDIEIIDSGSSYGSIINSCNSINLWFTPDSPYQSMKLAGIDSKGVRSLFFKSKLSRFSDQFKKSGSTENKKLGFVVADITRDVINQYGGTSEISRRNTDYSPIGIVYDIKNTASIKSYGDTYLSKTMLLRSARDENSSYTNKYSVAINDFLEIPLETTINPTESKNMSKSGLSTRNIDILTNVNDVFNRIETPFKERKTSYELTSVSKLSSTIMASKPKVDNEFIDSWSDFLINESMQLNSSFGSITDIKVIANQMFAIQTNAISAIAVNPRVQVQAADNVSIELGTGKVLHDYQYLSTTIGSRTKKSITVGRNGVYGYHEGTKKIFRIKPKQGVEFVSDAKRIAHASKKLNFETMNTEANLLLNEVLFTNIIDGKDESLIFNEDMDAFVGYSDLKSYNTCSVYEDSFSTKLNGNQIWISDKNSLNLYGSTIKCELEVLSVGEGIDNLFTNIDIKSTPYDERPFDDIVAENTFQTSLIGTKFKSKFNTWHYLIPRDRTNKLGRIRDKWTKIKLSKMLYNSKIHISDLKTTFNIIK